MNNQKRTVNKKLADSLAGYVGFSYQDMANRMSPTVSRSMISYIMGGKSCNARLQSQIAALLLPAFDDLIREVLHVDRKNFMRHLFPVSHDESVCRELTEEDCSGFPGKKEVLG